MALHQAEVHLRWQQALPPAFAVTSSSAVLQQLKVIQWAVEGVSLAAGQGDLFDSAWDRLELG